MTSHRLLPRVYTNESARTGASATRRRVVFVLALATVSVAGCGKSSDSEEKPSAATTSTADRSAAVPHEERVQLDSAAAAIAGIRVENADSTLTNGLPLTGAITYDQNRVTHIGARTLGRVIALPVDLGARVSRGQVLAELESPEVGQIRADEKQATALLRIARENYDREQRLATQGISSRKELLDAEAEVRRNEAALRSSEDRLAVLGAEHGTGGHFDVTAPFGGVVVARTARLGQTTTPIAASPSSSGSNWARNAGSTPSPVLYPGQSALRNDSPTRRPTMSPGCPENAGDACGRWVVAST